MPSAAAASRGTPSLYNVGAPAELVLSQHPDLVLLDLGLASRSGLGVLRRLCSAACPARIAVLTNRVEQACRTACLGAGADAFFDKSGDHGALLDQLQAWLPSMPANERERLQALRALNVRDMPAEANFDTLTALAAQLLGVPVVLVSLVDARRQWFKSRIGTKASETSGALSFCRHAINTDDVLVVEDIHPDPRFADNRLVVGNATPYAGRPLGLSGGEAIGTLCAIDHRPCQLAPTVRSILQEHRRQGEHRYMQLATGDPLAGQPGRVALLDRLNQALHAAARGATGWPSCFRTSTDSS